MASAIPHQSSHRSAQADDLLLRETNHRCSNDLQMVVSLLALQARRATNFEAEQALTDAMERVAILSRARAALHRDRHPSLSSALRQVCEALHAQAEPRSILVSLRVEDEVQGLSASQVMTLALAVNELATNAIKHAFAQDAAGHVRIITSNGVGRDATVIVDDDGLPFPELREPSGGFGLGLVRRLIESIGGIVIMPPPGTKRFELRVPRAF